MKIHALAVAVSILVFSCGTLPEDSTEDTNETPATDITWDNTPSDLGLASRLNETFLYACSPNGTFKTIWGTDLYTADSSICTAGVHAGRITQKDGGLVRIRIKAGQTEYLGSRRNGVTSESWGNWDSSFVVEE